MTLFIAVVNGLFAAIACVVLWRSARQVGNGLRRMLFASSVLSACYSVAYFWLAFHLDSTADWSNVMQWFGLAAWPLVWIAVPVAMIHWANHRANHLVNSAQSLVDQFDSGL